MTAAAGGVVTTSPATPLPVGTGRLETARLGRFTLGDGTVLPELVESYRHDGPGPETAPQVLVVHALTGSADAAGDWWERLIGPGRALDTDRVGVLGANLLGGRYGSTGPTTVDPSTGRPYGRSFPFVSTRDQARATWALLDALRIPRLAVVVGGSLGGMVALEVGLTRPTGVDHLVPIAAPAATGPMAVAWNRIQVELIDRLGDDGLSLARQLAMTTYRSEADFDERFDGDTYRILAGAMDRHDIGAGRGGIDAALAQLAVSDVRLTGIGIVDDILYGPRQVHQLVDIAREAGVDARYREIRSTKGHDAFLVEWDQLTTLLREALGSA